MIENVCQLADGRLLSWSKQDRSIRVWNLNDPQGNVALEHNGMLFGMNILNDGRVVSWSNESLRIWNPVTGEWAKIHSETNSVMGCVEIDKDRILTWSTYGTMRVWETSSASLNATVNSGNRSTVIGFSNVAPGYWISRCGSDSTIWVWNVEFGTCHHVFAEHSANTTSYCLDGLGTVVSADERGGIWVWNAVTGQTLGELKGHRDSAVVMMLDNGLVLSKSRDTTLRLWDIRTLKCTAVLEGHVSPVNKAIQLSDGSLLSWSGEFMSKDKALRRWDAQGKCLAVMDEHEKYILGACEIRDGRIVSWAHDKTLKIWNINTGECLHSFTNNLGDVERVRELSDGRIVACPGYSFGNAPIFQIINPDTGGSSLLHGHTKSSVYSDIIELQGDRLITWAGDGDLRLWNADVGTCLQVFSEHQVDVVGAGLLSDGSVVSRSYDDGAYRIWNPSTGLMRKITDSEFIDLGLKGDSPLVTLLTDESSRPKQMSDFSRSCNLWIAKSLGSQVAVFRQGVPILACWNVDGPKQTVLQMFDSGKVAVSTYSGLEILQLRSARGQENFTN